MPNIRDIYDKTWLHNMILKLLQVFGMSENAVGH